MSANTYEREETYRQTRVGGGNVEELRAALDSYLGNPEAYWTTDDKFIVLEEPLGECLTPWKEPS